MNLDPEFKKNIKKPLLIIGSIFAVLLLVIAVWKFFNTGKITITTNNNANTITLEKLNEKGAFEEEIASETGGELSKAVPAGMYKVKIGSRLVSSSKVIKLKGRQSVKHALNTPELKTVEPVAPSSAEDLLGFTDKGLLYFNLRGNLARLTGDNPEEKISETTFNNVKWGSNDFGVAQIPEGKLYVINNGTVSQINLPEELGDPKNVNFTVSNNNKVYVSVGNNIYLREDSGKYKKFYSAPEASIGFSAHDNDLAVFNPPNPDGDSEDKKSEPFLHVLNKRGDVVAQNKTQVFEAAWSPDGKKLLVIDNFGIAQIFTSSLKNSSQLPGDSIKEYSWLNSDTVIYGADSLLWSYDVSEDDARLLANSPAGETISGINIDTKNSYIYFIVSSEDKREIRRLGFKNQNISDNVKQLGVLLPTNSESCNISFLNYTEPTILISPEAVTNFQACVTAAKIELVNFDVSPDGFRYLPFVQTDPDAATDSDEL